MKEAQNSPNKALDRMTRSAGTFRLQLGRSWRALRHRSALRYVDAGPGMVDRTKIIGALVPEPTLVFQFFALFFRFESSLKPSGFLNTGAKLLIASLIYGAALRLRVQDIDSRRLCYADPHKMPRQTAGQAPSN